MTPILEIKSDIDLTEDQKVRLERTVYGNGHFDHEMGYADRSGVPKHAVAIHFLSEPMAGKWGSETRIVGLDDIQFRTGHEPHIYIEAEDGSVDGWNHCSGLIKSRWHYGLIMQDDDGGLWFCGTENSAGGDEITGDEPLKRIDPVTVAMVRQENGEILANLPADGEFWLSNEDLPKVTSIPWWGKIDPTEPNVREDAAVAMTALLEKVKTRIANAMMDADRVVEI